MVKSLLWMVVLIFLNACGVWQAKPNAAPNSVSQSKYQFDYRVDNGVLLGLLRVFDDGGTTYFQFRGEPPDGLVISSSTSTGEAIIPHEVMGNYAVIRGVYRQSSIPAAAQPVTVHKLGAIAPLANIGPVILPKVAKQATLTVEPEAQSVVANQSVSNASRIHSIRFRRNSAVLSSKDRKALAALLAADRNMGEVQIRVRAFYPNRPASVRLAEARGNVIRHALIDVGLTEGQVRISPQAASKALVAEVEFQVMQNQATRGNSSQTRLAKDGVSVLGMRLSSPASPE